jgi:uroporphyrinogen-III decarboxylase
MNGRERLWAAIRGEPVDRPPIWLREGFNIGGDLMAEPMEDVLGGGIEPEFRLAWKKDPLYLELLHYVESHVDVMRSWSVGGYINRFLMIPPEHIKREIVALDVDTFRVNGRVETPSGVLNFRDEIKRGINTYWHIENLVETVEDLQSLATVPFDLDSGILQPYLENFRRKLEALGDRGIMRIEYPSPIVAISATMSLENFLAMSVLQSDLFHQLLEIITQRLLRITDELFAQGPLETIVNLGGSEQCTPPLMAPESFDEFVVPYDGRIIARLKEIGIPVNMHCHGKVAHALKKMIEMGVDSSDPVEPPPAGNVSYAEARSIAHGKLTLVGNLEFDELQYSDGDNIRRRVREIHSFGKDHLIFSASAGPISAVTPRLVENYKVLIDTYREQYT